MNPCTVFFLVIKEFLKSSTPLQNLIQSEGKYTGLNARPASGQLIVPVSVFTTYLLVELILKCSIISLRIIRMSIATWKWIKRKKKLNAFEGKITHHKIRGNIYKRGFRIRLSWF